MKEITMLIMGICIAIIGVGSYFQSKEIAKLEKRVIDTHYLFIQHNNVFMDHQKIFGNHQRLFAAHTIFYDSSYTSRSSYDGR